MYSAEVFKGRTFWHLMLAINDQVLCIHTRRKLIEVIELASVLQIHITNLDELPLGQYLAKDIEDEILEIV